jgi:hypothetical protein
MSNNTYILFSTLFEMRITITRIWSSNNHEIIHQIINQISAAGVVTAAGVAAGVGPQSAHCQAGPPRPARALYRDCPGPGSESHDLTSPRPQAGGPGPAVPQLEPSSESLSPDVLIRVVRTRRLSHCAAGAGGGRRGGPGRVH